MFKAVVISFIVLSSLLLTKMAEAQSRFQQIQKGVNENTAKKDGSAGSGGSDGKTESVEAAPAELNDIIFLGVFETYIPTRKINARFTVYGEPRKFLLGHRACTKTQRIRDHINAYLFNHPPEKFDHKGQADTTGMDRGVRDAIKAALKTKLEYFTSIYVYSGLYSVASKPQDLLELTVTDCAGVIAKKAEMDKAK
ncbi:hypothetical protein [Terasakiella pusilla]|uniref:hypothetical protein n=1 Tax=Terasakiella pusilla TaxID=64973 RepID=UPI003AA8D575